MSEKREDAGRQVDRYESSEVNEIYAALAKAQASMAAASKDGANPHFRSSYTTLAGLVDAVRGPLTSNGICWTHQPMLIDGVLCVRTKLGHSSGQHLACDVPIETGPKGGMQAIGSAMTYAKRYGLSSLAGVASRDEDDDAETAEGRGNGGPRQGGRSPSRPPDRSPPQQRSNNGNSAPPETPETMARLAERARDAAHLTRIYEHAKSKGWGAEQMAHVSAACRRRLNALNAQQAGSVNREPGSDG